MRKTILAERYAKALARAARKHDVLEKVGQDLQVLARGSTLCHADINFWKNPMVEKADKLELFKRLASKVEMDDVLLRFLTMLVNKGRLWLITAIEQQYSEMVDMMMGRETVLVSSAHPLNEAVKTRLAQAMEARTGNQVHLIEKVDPSLLGGIRIKYGNSVIDGTVGARLRMMARAVAGD